MMPRFVQALAVAAALAGCSSSGEVSGSRIAAGNLMAMLNRQEPTAFPEPTRAQLDADGRPLIRAVIAESNANALLYPIAENGPVVTWTTVDARTLALRDGVLVQTRGLGADLMSSQVPTAAALSRGTGQVRRLHSYLGPNDQTVLMYFDCTLRNEGAERVTVSGLGYDTRRIAETCSDGTVSFQNRYWIQTGSKIRQSVQWAGPEVGNIAMFDLRR